MRRALTLALVMLGSVAQAADAGGSAVVPAAPPAAEPEPQLNPPEDDACTLDGDGFTERCEKLYYRTRLIALVAPSYVFWTDGLRVRHGLSITAAMDIPKGEWRPYYALGFDRRGLPKDVPSTLGIAATFVWLPPQVFDGHIVIRARVLSLAPSSWPVLSWFHLSVGAGAAGGTLGFAPRMEIRVRIGHTAWGGVALVAGFQPYIPANLFVGDIALGVEAPWLWWW